MIVVRVDLDSARGAHDDKHLFTMVIANDGSGTETRGNYKVLLGRRGMTSAFEVIRRPLRTGSVKGHARKSTHVGTLVAKALRAVRL